MKKNLLNDTIRTLREESQAPFYLFDLDAFRENIRGLREGIGPENGLCIAMKCNPFLAGNMAAAADRLEVCSFGEYRICRKAGIPSCKLLISGVLKKREDLAVILEECGGSCAYTVESTSQYRQLAAWAESHRTELRLYLRLASGSQFGMDRGTLQEILHEACRSPFLRVQGIHFYSGTQKKKADKPVRELQELGSLLISLQEAEHVTIPELEYGPGMSVSYFQDQKPDRETFLRQLREAAGRMQWGGRVTMEMGRAAAASCGYYVTRVCDLKCIDGRRFCIVDGGIHQLHYDGQIRGMYRPYVFVLPGDAAEADSREQKYSKASAAGAETDKLEKVMAGQACRNEPAEKKTWTVCGSLCTVNDVLAADLPLGELQEGDLLVFENTGAYSMLEGMSFFLSHELPGIAVFSPEEGGSAWLRRPMESWEMNFGR